MVRILKILLALGVAAWGLGGGLGNLADYGSGYGAVERVLSMETLESPTGLATRNAVVIHLGFAFIWALKLLGGVLCLVGVGAMWSHRHAIGDDWEAAKRWAVTGCGVIFFMLFFGFNFVATGLYQLFASPMAHATDLSWVFAGEVGIIMIFLHLRDR